MYIHTNKPVTNNTSWCVVCSHDFVFVAYLVYYKSIEVYLAILAHLSCICKCAHYCSFT